LGLILDSSILVAVERRGHTVSEILEQIRAVTGQTELGLSVITIAELVHGAYRARDDRYRAGKLAFIDELSRDLPIYPLGLETARSIGRIEGQLAASGISLAFEDLAIGVTALELGYAIATLNPRHFQLIPGLQVVSL
jgi:tRNA(fMet)-specific endonuclease VapC